MQRHQQKQHVFLIILVLLHTMVCFNLKFTYNFALICLLPNNILSIIKKPVNVLYLQKTDTYYILSLKKLMNRMEKNHECNKTQCRNY